MKTSILPLLALVSVLSFVTACSNGQPMCTPGASACACKASDVCDTGLVCGADKKCGMGAMVGLQVSDSAARGRKQ